MSEVKEPVVTVWRNRLPYPCTLSYWGRKWKFRTDTQYIRLIHLRPFRMWTVHAPIDDPERIEFNTVEAGGWHAFECYNADGSPLILGEKEDRS